MITINDKIDIPLYIQIYRQIRYKILNGDYLPGSKLLSTRVMSKYLGISRNTVELAYMQLCSEGYIVSKPKSGYYVENLKFTHYISKDDIIENKKISNTESTEKIKYDFKYGKVERGILPISKWQRITNKCINEFPDGFTAYEDTFGLEDFREEIVNYLKLYRGVNTSSEQVIIGAGVNNSLSMLSQVLKKHTSKIAVENPGYQIARTTFINHGFKTIGITLDKSGILLKDLELSGAGAVYVTPSHQYPFGSTMSIDRRIELINWAYENESYVIEDDYSCHLRYDIKPIQSLQSICSGRVIYIGSFSKYLFPSLRVSYMVIPKNMVKEFRTTFLNFPPAVSFQIQKTLSLFMKDGNFDSYIRKNSNFNKKKHDSLVRNLEKEFGDKIKIFGKNSGLHLIIEVKGNFAKDELIDKAYDKGVKVYSLSNFFLENNIDRTNCVLLGFGGITQGEIPHAVKLLRDAWL